MFHRASVVSNNPKKAQTNQETQSLQVEPIEINKELYPVRVESSAVEKYAKSKNTNNEPVDLANENRAFSQQPLEASAQTINSNVNQNTNHDYEKEVNSMNNPETQSNTQNEEKKPAIVQNRDVNIPGSNFQRPGAQPAAARSTYPGSYAGGNTVANNPYSTQGNTEGNGRKLVIGQGITMSGEIESCEHLIVEGTIEATLKGASVLDVYESGAFLGTVEIDEANIAGRFEGDITVRGRLTIESTGQVIGSITYKELSMEAGATIDGSVSPIGSQNANNATNKKTSAPKVKKASSNNGAELPFSDKAEAAE